MNQINLINHKTLALVLTLALASSSVLSLRSVRLKIGDYYYHQRKFEQAANWYERVVRKERLKISRVGIDYVKYEDDLFKLKSAVSREMEERLLSVSQILGFGESNNLRSLILKPDYFLKGINHLFGTEPREGLKMAKVKLEYLYFFETYRNSLEKNNKSEELNYLASMGHFFKGIINESENNFILADSNYEKAAISYPSISSQLNERRKRISLNVANEYFSRSPLNWVKARDLFESYIKNGNLNNADTLIKLGYIYAKWNNFNMSYDFFKRAYQLLVDADLEKIVNYFKKKGVFLYPDDLRLIPKKVSGKYPLLQDISFFEAKNLLNTLAIEVKANTSRMIGNTGINSPVDIIIRSAGIDVGNYGLILINGKNASQNGAGYNISILNPKTGEVEKSGSFNTCSSKDDVKRMIVFIKSVEKGKIVCVAVAHEASVQLSLKEGRIFEEIGAKENLHGRYKWAHGIIGVKGSKYGDAIEAVSEKPLEIYVVNRES